MYKMYMYIMHFTRILSLSLNIQYKFDTFVNGWYIVRIQIKLAMCILRHHFSMEMRNIQFLMKSWLCKNMYFYDNKSNVSSFDP